MLHLLKCHGVGTFTGTTTVTHNADNEASPITVPVTLECRRPISIAVSADPTRVMAGGESRLSALVRFDPQNLGVEWSVDGPGQLINRSNSTYYVAPLQVAGTEPITITVTATSKANSDYRASRELTVYPIAVSARPEDIRISSGERIRLYGKAARDATAQGLI